MLNAMNHESFVAYATTALALSLQLLGLWLYSAVVRAKSGIAINEEDAALQKIPLQPLDPPAVARVLRVHQNGLAIVPCFLFLGLIAVLAGAPALHVEVLFAVFVAARYLHSLVYLAGKQPWRTIFFLISLLAIIGLMVEVIWLIAR